MPQYPPGHPLYYQQQQAQQQAQQQQQQQQGPHVQRAQAGNKVVEICSECRNVVAPGHSYQGPDNLIYKKRSCTVCGVIFAIEGPYRTHMEANPKEFK